MVIKPTLLLDCQPTHWVWLNPILVIVVGGVTEVLSNEKMSYKSSKLFNIEDRKSQTGIATTEVDVFQWKSTLLEELRKNDAFTTHLAHGATWGLVKDVHRGFKGDDAETKAKAVEALLTKLLFMLLDV